MASTREVFRLLELPAELRNHVYDHLLPIGRYYGIGCVGANTVKDLRSLSQVNKQLRNDTLPMFYGNTEFLISIRSTKDLKVALEWLARLDNCQASLIRDLTFYVQGAVQVRFTAQPGQKSAVSVFSHILRRTVWVPIYFTETYTRSMNMIVAQINQLLDGLHSTTPTNAGDSGLRVFHIARMFSIIIRREFFDDEQRHLLKRLGDRRETGTWTRISAILFGSTILDTPCLDLSLTPLGISRKLPNLLFLKDSVRRNRSSTSVDTQEPSGMQGVRCGPILPTATYISPRKRQKPTRAELEIDENCRKVSSDAAGTSTSSA